MELVMEQSLDQFSLNSHTIKMFMEKIKNNFC